jgi:hypothetical protein
MTKSRVFPLSALQFSVLCFLVQTLETRQIAYQITGGLAGNIYGSERPLGEIALQIAGIDRPRVAAAFAAYASDPNGGPSDLPLAALYLQIQGVPVDFSQAELGRAGALPVDLAKRLRMDFLGLMLCVQPLEDLIQAQTRSGADVADLLRLI